MNEGQRSTQSHEPAAAIEALMVLRAQTRLRGTLGGTPLGDRSVFDIAGGSFEGPGLRGEVPASGGDWLIRTPAASQMDVRMLLQTDDGVTLLFRYTGRSSLRAGEVRIEISGSFDAPEGRYGWLNRIQAFGLGTPAEDGVCYHLYRFK